MDAEDDFLARANSDIAQLCAENILQWRLFLQAASQPVIHQLLAKRHHQLRYKIDESSSSYKNLITHFIIFILTTEYVDSLKHFLF